MEYGAIDLHAQRSFVRIVSEDGTVVLERTIATSARSFEQVFGGRARGRLLIESGTDTEWVAQRLEACGQEVIVADPNYSAMYAARGRRIKTDRRDVAALAEANRLGIYRRAHRVSPEQRQRRRRMRVREQLVGVRTQTINLLRAQLRQEGYRVPSGSAEAAVARYRRVGVAPALDEAVAPLIALLEHLAPAIYAAEAETARAATADPVTARLMTVPGIGPVTALTYRAVIDDAGRFADARGVSAYLGLVPSEHRSGGRRRPGAITKVGSGRVRRLLVQAAWSVWRQRRRRSALAVWAEQLAARRGAAIAIVALARRLARIMFALWRDHTTYRVAPVRI